MEATQQSFAFGKRNKLPQYFVSAAEGTNVVKVKKKFMVKSNTVS